MTKKVLALAVLLFISTSPLFASFIKVQGIVEKGGQPIVVNGVSSSTRSVRTFPGATVTICPSGVSSACNGGAGNLAAIYSNSTGTPTTNPLHADSAAAWFAYLSPGTYDILFTPSSFAAWTLSSVTIGSAGSGGVYINVQDAPYNARGDCSTDDTAAFKLARDTGLNMWVPPVNVASGKCYRLTDDINLLSGQSIEGAGYNSYMKLVSASTNGQFVGALGTALAPKTGVVIRGLHLDTNNQGAENGVGFSYSIGSITENCYFSHIGRKAWTIQIGCIGDKFLNSHIFSAGTGANVAAITIEGTNSGSVDTHGATIDNISIDTVGSTSFAVQVSAATRCTIRNVYVNTTLLRGVSVTQAATDNVFERIVIKPTYTNRSVNIDVASLRNKFLECDFGSTSIDGAINIAASSTDNEFVDCNVTSTGGATLAVEATCDRTRVRGGRWSASGDVFQLAGGTGHSFIDPIVVAANRIIVCPATNIVFRGLRALAAPATVGIQLSAGSTGCVIDGCYIPGALANRFVVQTSGNTIVNNVIDSGGSVDTGSSVLRNTVANNSWQPVIQTGTSVPTTGTWAVGDTVMQSAPSVGNPIGWKCTVAGSPGTWAALPNL